MHSQGLHSKHSINVLNKDVDIWRKRGYVLFTLIIIGFYILEIQPLEMTTDSSVRHTPGSFFISLCRYRYNS